MSRRSSSLLMAAVLIALLAGAAVFVIVADDDDQPAAAIGSGSTLAGTWVDLDGNGILERGPGERLIDRTDLAAASPLTRTLATLVQLTDSHVRDEESPARASLLDRVDPDLNSAFRPQEALSPQVLGAVLTSIDELSPDAVLITGDLIDSNQSNELDQFLATVKGGAVNPDSGGPGYQGPQEASNPDPFFYRPDLDAPRHPGLLDDAEDPFQSPGIQVPWYPIVGNHDLLVQGEVPRTPDLEALATGDRLLTGLRRNLQLPGQAAGSSGDGGSASGGTNSALDLPNEAALSPELVNGVIGGNGLPGPTEAITPDSSRRHLPAAAVLSRLRAASGVGGSGPRMDYSFDIGPEVRVIALDLVDRAGGSGGIISPGQPQWLHRQLARAGDRWVIVMTHQPIHGSKGGGGLLRELDRDRNVIATLAGDTHKNSLEPRQTAAGGYWQIETSSLADYPQQARAIRVVSTADGGAALETWMVDGTGSPLADTARQLSYLDAQGGRPQGDIGEVSDRNARLYR